MSSDERTAAKQAVIDEVADDRGEKWAEDNAALILAQATLAGEL